MSYLYKVYGVEIAYGLRAELLSSYFGSESGAHSVLYPMGIGAFSTGTKATRV
jgi:hypothetical protein